MVQSSLDLLSPELEDKKINLINELSDNPLAMRIDKQILRVALCPLVRNALAAALPRGTLLVRTLWTRIYLCFIYSCGE